MRHAKMQTWFFVTLCGNTLVNFELKTVENSQHTWCSVVLTNKLVVDFHSHFMITGSRLHHLINPEYVNLAILT